LNKVPSDDALNGLQFLHREIHQGFAVVQVDCVEGVRLLACHLVAALLVEDHVARSCPFWSHAEKAAACRGTSGLAPRCFVLLVIDGALAEPCGVVTSLVVTI